MATFEELDDDEINNIPADLKVRVVQLQVEKGREELQEAYKQFEQVKVDLVDLEFNEKELQNNIASEKKKLQVNNKNKDNRANELRKIHNQLSQLEDKLRQLGPEHKGNTIKDSEVNELVRNIENAESTVLKLQVQLEKRTNELQALDLNFKSEVDQLDFDLRKLEEEKKKTMELIGLHMHKLSLLKQKNISLMRSVAASSLDAQLTAKLEAFIDN